MANKYLLFTFATVMGVAAVAWSTGFAGWGHDGGRHGINGMAAKNGGHAMMLCFHKLDLDMVSGVVKQQLSLNARQQKDWNQLLAAIGDGHKVKQKICRSAMALAGQPAPAKLDWVETSLQQSLDFVHGIKPVFNRFYQGLDKSQQQKLQAWMQKHHQPG